MNTARLTGETLEGFDFSFQPCLDRDRIMALAQLDFVDRTEVVLPRPAWDRQEPPGNSAGRRRGQCRQKRLSLHARRTHRSADPGETRGPAVEKIRFYSRASP